MYYFTLTGSIEAKNTGDLIHFFNNKIIDEDYKDPFTIYISSIGGDIDSAIRVYDFLKSIKNKIHIVGFSQIDSAALIIFLAGDKRVALENTRFRFHKSIYHTAIQEATLDVFEEKIGFFQAMDLRCQNILNKEFGKNIQKINNLISTGKVLNTNEAFELKIINEVIKTMPTPKALC